MVKTKCRQRDTKERSWIYVTKVPRVQQLRLNRQLIQLFSHSPFLSLFIPGEVLGPMPDIPVKQNKTGFCCRRRSDFSEGDERQEPRRVWDLILFVSQSDRPQLRGCWRKTWDFWSEKKGCDSAFLRPSVPSQKRHTGRPQTFELLINDGSFLLCVSINA